MKAFVFVAFLAVAYAAHVDGVVPIVRQTSDTLPDGSYEHSYESGDGTKAEARGIVKNAGSKDKAQEVSGSFEFVSTDGQKYSVHYVANEYGYQAEGAHLPVAPEPEPIPHYIQRALDWIAAHPQKEEHVVGGRKH